MARLMTLLLISVMTGPASAQIAPAPVQASAEDPQPLYRVGAPRANAGGISLRGRVLWAITPEGRPKNLGELQVHDARARRGGAVLAYLIEQKIPLTSRRSR